MGTRATLRSDDHRDSVRSDGGEQHCCRRFGCSKGKVEVVRCCSSVPMLMLTLRRPNPLSTIELQKRVSRSMHISSEKTMEVGARGCGAAHLTPIADRRAVVSGWPHLIPPHRDGQVSLRYGPDGPRCKAERIPDLGCLRKQVRCRPSLKRLTCPRLLEGEFQWPGDGGHDDKAHPPIHPTKFTDSFQSSDHSRVYEFVVRHFLACCSSIAARCRASLTFQKMPLATRPRSMSPSRGSCSRPLA